MEPGEPAPAVADATGVETTLYLVGDAGGPEVAGEPVLLALENEIASRQDAQHEVIVFLGDNIYPSGMPAPGTSQRTDAERRLMAQVRVATATGSEAVFIPGNHDWAKSGRDGWDRVLRQERFVEAQGNGNVWFEPDRGCPGPGVRDVGDRVRLVFIDTEWWLRPDGKPEHPFSTCPADAEWEVIAALDSILADAGERHIIVAGHHPLLSSGPHGGHFTILEHLFPLRELKSWLWIPLPVIGSLYPIARRTGITNQDLSGSRNRSMRSALDSIFMRHRPLAYASGHEHALQVLEGGRGASVLIVSGAGNYGHVSAIRKLPETLYQAEASGYVRLDVQRDGRVRLGVVLVDAAGRRTEPFAMFIEEVR
ncbi:MAG: metallophosphoesterase [Gemmatimonadetes bacterium]|nr:metallophosphoesterase [Gemmatimonadota bacterium]